MNFGAVGSDVRLLVQRGARAPWFVLLSACGLLVACGKTGDAQADSSSGVSAGPAGAVATQIEARPAEAAAGVPPVAAPPSHREEAFELRLLGPSEAKVGAAFEIMVELTPQSGYKVNEEYPIKFAFAEVKGLGFEPVVLKKEQGTVDKKHAMLRGLIKVLEPGKHQVGGKLSFSVCTEERCLIEKRDLGLTIDAS